MFGIPSMHAMAGIEATSIARAAVGEVSPVKLVGMDESLFSWIGIDPTEFTNMVVLGGEGKGICRSS